MIAPTTAMNSQKTRRRPPTGGRTRPRPRAAPAHRLGEERLEPSAGADEVDHVRDRPAEEDAPVALIDLAVEPELIELDDLEDDGRDREDERDRCGAPPAAGVARPQPGDAVAGP